MFDRLNKPKLLTIFFLSSLFASFTADGSNPQELDFKPNISVEKLFTVPFDSNFTGTRFFPDGLSAYCASVLICLINLNNSEYATMSNPFDQS